jgi:hypothetical protein
MTRYPCPCCGYYTYGEPPGTGSYNICPVCYWEDDPVQFADPTFAGGANEPSLERARKNFLVFGANAWRDQRHVRPPRDDEMPPKPNHPPDRRQ